MGCSEGIDMFKFEKLEVWQKAIDFSLHIHTLTRKFPKDELYILTSQIKRASDSIALNIAEGSTGQSDAEFHQFLGYALRSAIEVVSCLHVGKARNIVTEDDFQVSYDKVTIIVKMLQALRNTLRPH
jgi:four helix bundle protein